MNKHKEEANYQKQIDFKKNIKLNKTKQVFVCNKKAKLEFI
ncbi:unnamed protein product [Paramecium sonneborni]|uniref:Uncharacterized protein n=1 Tax=Paramecium sonneborni TaxID=65129 RepID=A0A8S1PAU3_9CILI|nr:unnamed protein product [Paramecium sonneborni]